MNSFPILCQRLNRRASFTLLFAIWITLLIAPAAAFGQYQVVFDVEEPCFEIFNGNWTLEKSGTYLGSFYYAISGPGSGSGTARWTAEGLPAGSYLVECWANNGNYAADARYQVICADGVHEISLNMNYVAAGWHSLGTFTIDRVCVVNINDYWIGAGNLLSVDALRFTYQGTVPPPPATEIVPHFGLCIDDAGGVNPTDPSKPIYKMLRLPFPLTIAVMPSLSYTVQTANEVVARGSEVILHQPMAAISFPNPGAGGITDSMTLAQVRTTVANNLDALPNCIGMNNHMGSLITQQTDKMQVCMEELKARNQFFFDSRTITTSVGYDVAKTNGLLTAERDLFVDGNSKEASKALIRSLALRALYAPHVTFTAIGHVRDDTAAALEEMVPELEAMGVEIWPISRCMTQIIETDNQPVDTSVLLEGAWIQDSQDAYSKELYSAYSQIVPDVSNRNDRAVFNPVLSISGDYDIHAIWHVSSANTATATARIQAVTGTSYVPLDQTQQFLDWFYLGRYSCEEGSWTAVEINDAATIESGKALRADAVRFTRIGDQSETSVLSWDRY